MSPIRRNHPDLAPPAGPYSHMVRHGDTLYTSGFTAFGTGAETGDICAQARAVFAQLGALAEDQGSSLAHLVKVTVFVTELNQVGALRDTLFEIYGENIPASSLIRVAGLFAPQLKIEVEAVFACPG